MTTYGTIPSESYAEPHTRIIASNAKERIVASLGTKRPWTLMFQLQSFDIPSSFALSLDRIRINALFFRYNYVVLTLFILFLSMLWHPVSLIVFTIMMAAWLFLYFLRDDPLIVLGFLIHDRLVMTLLVSATLFIIFFTTVTDNMIIAFFLGLGVVLVHGGLRRTDDLMYYEDEDGFGSVGNLPVSDAVPTLPLRNAAAASFSSS